MIQYERLDARRRERGITWSFLESVISSGYRGKFVDFRKGKTTFTADDERALAGALDTTTQYLSGKVDDPSLASSVEGQASETKEKAPALTKKDERDISKKLEETLSQLETAQGGLMFDGEPLDDTTRELLAISLRNSMEMGKKLAKEKYTPKKYRK